ncbi:hypothetical protein B0T22DRAFT_438613 [Podospora appendiculata]|uniref:F-box domain-containing protein n=1 Tax=Podospora appendiculata TaxID=314037 RepID=A0AAE0XLK5_9PEZI|nr:hypothetical protein B0T22DRAFT_438613 [Podospora appendiculata]
MESTDPKSKPAPRFQDLPAELHDAVFEMLALPADPANSASFAGITNLRLASKCFSKRGRRHLWRHRIEEIVYYLDSEPVPYFGHQGKFLCPQQPVGSPAPDDAVQDDHATTASDVVAAAPRFATFRSDTARLDNLTRLAMNMRNPHSTTSFGEIGKRSKKFAHVSPMGVSRSSFWQVANLSQSQMLELPDDFCLPKLKHLILRRIEWCYDGILDMLRKNQDSLVELELQDITILDKKINHLIRSLKSFWGVMKSASGENFRASLQTGTV